MNSQPRVAISDLQSIVNSNNLNDLCISLAKVKRRQNGVFKGDGLKRVVDHILCLAHNDEKEHALLAVAALGSLSTTEYRSEIIEKIGKLHISSLPSLDTLADSEQKENAVKIVCHMRDTWVDGYLIQEILTIELAENVRKELLKGALERNESLTNLFTILASHPASDIPIQANDSRLRKVRRIFGGLESVVAQWEGELGTNPGKSLARLFSSIAKGKIDGADQKDLISIVDHCLNVIKRIIELRFSNALHADTYIILEEAKKILGYRHWETFLTKSRTIHTIRTNLLEAAIVLARQDRTDESLRGIIRICYARSNRYKNAINKHFGQANDIAPDDKLFWLDENSNFANQQTEHKIGNSVDEQIAQLLIVVESTRIVIGKMGSDIIPQIESSDPLSASTVKKAERSFIELSQIVRRLARMRKLTLTKLKGRRVEYNAKFQLLLDGHRAGVRNVVVTRDGVLKKFGNNERTLVKPWVEIEK